MPTSDPRPRIAVIVPCLDEERHVAAVIASLPERIDLVVAVDDGSKDGTLAVLHGLHEPRLHVVCHERTRGVGAAMLSGYARALELGAAVCVKMDGDGQMDPEHLPALLAPLLDGQAHYAKGNRFRHLQALKAMPWPRLLGNGLFSFLTKLVSGYWNVFDPANGFTGIRADVLRRLPLQRLHDGYFFETSLLVELNILGAVVRDVDIPARYGDERSSLRPSRVARQFPLLCLAALLRRFFWRYMVADFNTLTVCVLAGLPSLLFGLVFGLVHWSRSIATGVPATAGTVLVAALPFLLGTQALLMALVLDMLYQPREAPGELIGETPTEDDTDD